MITDLIVVASIGLGGSFVAAWALSPAWRRWIERPKHRFLDAVRGYDQAGRLDASDQEWRP